MADVDRVKALDPRKLMEVLNIGRQGIWWKKQPMCEQLNYMVPGGVTLIGRGMGKVNVTQGICPDSSPKHTHHAHTHTHAHIHTHIYNLI